MTTRGNGRSLPAERALRVSRLCSCTVSLLGSFVLCGWALDAMPLIRLHPAFASMQPNAALLFVLLGVALGIREGKRGSLLVRRALATLVLAVAGATLLESLMRLDFGIDQLLFRDPVSVAQGLSPARMSPAVSLCFVLLATALLARRAGQPDSPPARASVLLAGVASLIALAGYLFGVESLYQVGPLTSTALHTVLGFLAASTAFLLARPKDGLMAVIMSPSAAGVLLRRMLPVAALGTLLLGWLQVPGQSLHVAQSPFRIAVLTVGDVIVLSTVMYITAARLHHSDLELGASEQRFRLMVEALRGQALFMLDREGRVAMWNAGAERFHRYRADEILGRHISIFYPPQEVQAGKPARDLEAAARAGRWEGEAWRVHGDGTRFRANVVISAISDPDGVAVGFAQLTRDVTARYREAEERRRAAREREELRVQTNAAELFRERARFFELSIDMVCIANTDGRFLQINPAFSANLGYRREEILDRNLTDFVHPQDRDATWRELAALAGGQPTLDFTNRYVRRDGSIRWFQWRAASEPDGTIYAVARDVSHDRELLDTLQRQQASLSASLNEREVLLQEVHHRVKNNLQLVSSLLNLQVHQLTDPIARDALEECKSRIETIALIHEKLYQAHDYARVPFSEYVKLLAGHILHASGVAPDRVQLSLETDEILLAVDRAIPCALLLNELLTNSLKHAFPDGRRGRLRVLLHRVNGHLQLTVADDGVGMPPGFNPASSASLGMQLVATLSEQLDGHLEIDRSPGTTFRLDFSAEGQA